MLSDKDCFNLGAREGFPEEPGRVVIRRFEGMRNLHAGYSIPNAFFAPITVADQDFLRPFSEINLDD